MWMWIWFFITCYCNAYRSFTNIIGSSREICRFKNGRRLISRLLKLNLILMLIRQEECYFFYHFMFICSLASAMSAHSTYKLSHGWKYVTGLKSAETATAAPLMVTMIYHLWEPNITKKNDEKSVTYLISYKLTTLHRFKDAKYFNVNVRGISL